MVQPFIGEDRAGTGPRAFVGLRRRIPPLDLCEELPHFRILVELLYLVGQDLVSPDAPLDKSPDALLIGGPVRVRVERPRSGPPFVFQQLHHEECVFEIGTTKPQVLVKALSSLNPSRSRLSASIGDRLASTSAPSRPPQILNSGAPSRCPTSIAA